MPSRETSRSATQRWAPACRRELRPRSGLIGFDPAASGRGTVRVATATAGRRWVNEPGGHVGHSAMLLLYSEHGSSRGRDRVTRGFIERAPRGSLRYCGKAGEEEEGMNGRGKANEVGIVTVPGQQGLFQVLDLL